jgi:ribonuclease-3
VISEALHARHPDDDEGLLSARRAAIVSTAGLARLARRIDLGEYLLLGEGEAQRGGRNRPALLAAALEALAAAIFLDRGWPAVRAWLVELAGPELASDVAPAALKNPKSRLQELAQHGTGGRPVYHLVEVSGPDHQRRFAVEVALDGTVIGRGAGASRRSAEAAAAAAGLLEIGEGPTSVEPTSWDGSADDGRQPRGAPEPAGP